MANYIPWYGEKKARLDELEHAFLTLLQEPTDLKRLREAGDAVRLAKVRALKARRAMLPPSEKVATAIANLDREIQFWLTLSADQVVEGYRNGSLRKFRVKGIRRSPTS